MTACVPSGAERLSKRIAIINKVVASRAGAGR